MVAISTLTVALMHIGRQVSRLDGIILICTFLVYIAYMFKRRKGYPLVLKESGTRWEVIGHTLLIPISLAALFYSAGFVVESGSELALSLALPPIFVGLFFIALGTSLPELVFECKSVLAGHSGLALGDLIGSVIVNSTIVLGIAAIITPITGNIFLFMTSSFFMIVVCFMFAVMLETEGKISWKEGVILLMMYVLFLMVEFSLKQFYIVNGI